MNSTYSNTHLCKECVRDEHLSRHIEANCQINHCDECGLDDNQAISVEALGKILAPIVKENFALGETIKRFDENDHDYWEQEGESLSDIVQDVLSQYFNCHDQIVTAMCNADDAWPADGEDTFFDATSNYVESPVRLAKHYENWTGLLIELKHKRRFFSPSAREHFKRLFEGVERLSSDDGEGQTSVIWEIPAGQSFYRARSCDLEKDLVNFHMKPMESIGPPPSNLARAGRMNAEGVRVFYGATDIDTCIAEVRPAIGSSTAVIMIESMRPLRLLDFIKLETVIGNLSYFQQDFKVQVERNAFLRRLHSLISQPILLTNTSDYLITQTMAEYLAHEHDLVFDGIVFASTQRKGGKNVVIFPTAQEFDGFALKYVEGSIKFFTTNEVNYLHHENNFSLVDGIPYIHIDYNDN